MVKLVVLSSLMASQSTPCEKYDFCLYDCKSYGSQAFFIFIFIYTCSFQFAQLVYYCQIRYFEFASHLP